jgi:hypothetical protein
MQVTTGEALRALKAVSQLAEMRMPFGPAMAVRKMVRELGQVSEDAEAERQKLVVVHAVIGEDGKPKVEGNRYVFADPLAFERAYADLMAAQVEVPTALTAKGMDSVEVEPSLLLALGPLLVE